MTFQVADVISQTYTFTIAFTVLTVFSPGFSLMFLVFTISGMICNEYYVRKSDELRTRMAPDVRKVFGVLFQDYVTYCLPLREIIALSDFGGLDI